MLDGLAEPDHLVACRAATVDQHQRLLVVHASAAQRAAFPATLLNHPASGNLLVVSIYIIMWHVGIAGSQFLILPATHDGVHEEAAGIARQLWVGQLGPANVDDGLAQLTGRRLADALPLQLCTYVAIVELGLKRLAQLEVDLRDEVAVAPLVLEAAVAVAIAALSVLEATQLARGNLHGPHPFNQVLGLSPIGPNILHGCRPHVARNERQVLGTIETVGDGSFDHPVPLHATATEQAGAVNASADGVRPDDDAGEIARQQQVAAAADDEERLGAVSQDGRYPDGLFRVLVAQVAATAGVDAKSVVA